MFRIAIEDGTFIDLEEDATHETAAKLFAATPAASTIAEEVGRSSYYTAWSHDGTMDDAVAREIAKAYLEGGIDAVSDMAIENGWDHAPEDYFENAGVKDDLRRRVMPAAEKIAETADWLDEDHVADAIVEALQDTVVEAMRASDTSKIKDAIPGHCKVELPFIPGSHQLAVDDMHLRHYGIGFSAETAIPDANLMRALKFFNVSPSEFVDEAARRGIDLLSVQLPENAPEYRREQAEAAALRWRAVLDIENRSTKNISKLPLRSKGEIADWNETVELARTAKDHDRPAALSMDELFTVMDNASYGGVPAYVARLPLRDLLDGKFDRPFLATGGFVGIHDFINGSGYIEKPAAPVLVNPSAGAFRMFSTRRDAVDEVYGIVGSYYSADITPTEIPAWQRHRENGWTLSSEDGRRAEITSETADEGVTEYWLGTFGPDGDEAGPRGTKEVFLDLAQAQEEGERALASEWACTPTP